MKIPNKAEPTITACNGNSVIDQCLISGKMTNQTFFLAANEDVKLIKVVRSRPSKILLSQRKPWIDEANSEEWREVIKSKLEIVQEDDPTALWPELVKIVREPTDSSIPFTTTNKHSKRFRNDAITIASHSLRYIRKRSSTSLTQVTGLSSMKQGSTSRSSVANTPRSGCRILLWNPSTEKAKTIYGHITDSSNQRLERWYQ